MNHSDSKTNDQREAWAKFLRKTLKTLRRLARNPGDGILAMQANLLCRFGILALLIGFITMVVSLRCVAFLAQERIAEGLPLILVLLFGLAIFSIGFLSFGSAAFGFHTLEAVHLAKGKIRQSRHLPGEWQAAHDGSYCVRCGIKAVAIQNRLESDLTENIRTTPTGWVRRGSGRDSSPANRPS